MVGESAACRVQEIKRGERTDVVQLETRTIIAPGGTWGHGALQMLPKLLAAAADQTAGGLWVPLSTAPPAYDAVQEGPHALLLTEQRIRPPALLSALSRTVAVPVVVIPLDLASPLWVFGAPSDCPFLGARLAVMFA